MDKSYRVISKNNKSTIDSLAALKHWANQISGMTEFEIRYAEKEYEKMNALYADIINVPLYKRKIQYDR